MDDKSFMDNCNFCKYLDKKITRDDLRVYIDYHEESECSIQCTLCGKKITF